MSAFTRQTNFATYVAGSHESTFSSRLSRERIARVMFHAFNLFLALCLGVAIPRRQR